MGAEATGTPWAVVPLDGAGDRATRATRSLVTNGGVVWRKRKREASGVHSTRKATSCPLRDSVNKLCTKPFQPSI